MENKKAHPETSSGHALKKTNLNPRNHKNDFVQLF